MIGQWLRRLYKSAWIDSFSPFIATNLVSVYDIYIDLTFSCNMEGDLTKQGIIRIESNLTLTKRKSTRSSRAFITDSGYHIIKTIFLPFYLDFPRQMLRRRSSFFHSVPSPTQGQTSKRIFCLSSRFVFTWEIKQSIENSCAYLWPLEMVTASRSPDSRDLAPEDIAD